VNLSPAAKAALQAFNERHELLGPFEGNWQEVCLAAAFEALANHQTPRWDGDGPLCHWHPEPYTRQELRGMAQELRETDP
jgi:hypothetical protein